MFACNFQEYTGFGDTPMEAWENLRVALEVTYYDETEPEECLFFKQIEVNITPREFDIQETE